MRASDIQKQLEDSVTGAEDRKVLDAMLAQRKIFNDIRNDVFRMKDAGNDEMANAAYDSKMAPATLAYSNSIRELVTFERGVIDSAATSIDNNYRSGRSLLLGLGAAAQAQAGRHGAWPVARVL